MRNFKVVIILVLAFHKTANGVARGPPGGLSRRPARQNE